MESRILGRTGVRVSVLGLGTGLFGSMGKVSEEDGIRIVHAALDGGINLIDSADLYSYGEAETITGKAIRGRRDRILLMSKFGFPMSDDPNEGGGSRRWVIKAVERSLRRLDTDYLDVFQLHAPDFDTPLEETIGALDDLVRAGKIRYFGTSNSSAARIQSAGWVSRLKGLNAPYTEQSAYSIFRRGIEAELLPACDEHGTAFMAYAPLDGGWLSGRHRKGQPRHDSPRQALVPSQWDMSNPVNQTKLEIVERLATVAEEAGVDLLQLAIGFVLAHRSVACALAGAGKVEHIEGFIRKCNVRLGDDILDAIDAIVPPGMSIPEERARSPQLADASLRRRSAGTVARR